VLKFKEQMAQKEQGAAAPAAATAQFIPSFGGAFVTSVPPIPIATEVSLVTLSAIT